MKMIRIFKDILTESVDTGTWRNLIDNSGTDLPVTHPINALAVINNMTEVGNNFWKDEYDQSYILTRKGFKLLGISEK